MKKFILFFSSLFGLATMSIAQNENRLSDSITNQLKINVAGFRDRYHSPSIVVVVVHDKNIVFADALGYADIENMIPATINSKYPIMSLTKTFTATMLMQLKQRGLVRLGDDVRKYLPTFHQNIKNPESGVTTLFQLATHTSGLPRNSSADIDFTEQIDRFVLRGSNDEFLSPATDQQVLNSIKDVKYEYPKFQFLHYSDRHYSNLGYSLLGLAIQNASKRNYKDYIGANIFKPLQMLNSGFINDTLYKGTLSKGYIYRNEIKSFEKVPYFRPNAAMYSGGMYTTAVDLAKFLSFQFDHNSTEANRILSDENKAMMIALNIAWKPAYPFTMHEGAMLGYRSEMVFDPANKIGWVILTNTTNFDFGRINDVFAKILSAIYVPKSKTIISEYAGKYWLIGRSKQIEISIKNDSLYSNYMYGILPSKPLIQIGIDRFKGDEKDNYNINYEFVRDGKGRIRYVNMGQLMWEKR